MFGNWVFCVIFSSSGHDLGSPWLYWQRLTDALPAREELFPLWHGSHPISISPQYLQNTPLSLFPSEMLLPVIHMYDQVYVCILKT